MRNRMKGTKGSRRPRPRPRPESQYAPWLVYENDRSGSQTFFSLSKGATYFCKIPEMERYEYQPLIQGWMLILDTTRKTRISYHKNGCCSLLNPTNGTKIALPPLERELRNDWQFLLSTSPADPDCTVMCADIERRRLLFCKPGGKKWVSHKYGIEEEEMPERWSNVNGKFYGITGSWNLAVIDLASSPQIRVLENIDFKWPDGLPYAEWFLLESCGEMCSVMKFFTGSESSKTVHMMVLKRDPKSEEWNKLDSIGDDCVFLLGPVSFAVAWSASELGVKGDCIYFTEEDECLYIFDMKEGSIEVRLPCSKLSKNQNSEPFWLMPAV